MKVDSLSNLLGKLDYRTLAYIYRDIDKDYLIYENKSEGWLIAKICEKLSTDSDPVASYEKHLLNIQDRYLTTDELAWIDAKKPHLINFLWLMLINKRTADLFHKDELAKLALTDETWLIKYMNIFTEVLQVHTIEMRQKVIIELIDKFGNRQRMQQLLNVMNVCWGYVERFIPRVPWIENASEDQALYISEAIFRLKDKTLIRLKKEYLECFRIEEYNIALYAVFCASIFPTAGEVIIGKNQDVALKSNVVQLQKLIAKVRKSFNQRLKRERQRKEHESIHLSYPNYEKLRLLSKLYKTTPKAFLNNMIKQIHKDQIVLHQDFVATGERYPIDVKGLYDLKNKPKYPEPNPSSLLQPYSAKYNKKPNAESSTDSEAIKSVASDSKPETLSAPDSGISDHSVEQTNSTNAILAESVTGDGLVQTNCEVVGESVYGDDVSEHVDEVVAESLNSNGLIESTGEAVADSVNSDDGLFEATGEVVAGFATSDCQSLPTGTVEISTAPTHSQVLSLTRRTSGLTVKNS